MSEQATALCRGCEGAVWDEHHKDCPRHPANRIRELEEECCRRTLHENAQAVRIAELEAAAEKTWMDTVENYVKRDLYEFALGKIDEAEKARDKLQAFKTWVHSYLDAHGVPHHPPGPHGAEGCRIGDRMDWLMAQLRDADEQASANGARCEKLARGLSDALAALAPFAQAYADGLREKPQLAAWPADVPAFIPYLPLGAWRAAHEALEGKPS